MSGAGAAAIRGRWGARDALLDLAAFRAGARAAAAIPAEVLPAEEVAVPPTPSIAAIVAAVADVSGVSAGDILSLRGDQERARARHVAMFLAWTMTHRTWGEIGAAFRRDRTSCSYGFRVVHRRRHTCPVTADLVNRAIARLSARGIGSPAAERK